MTTAQALLLASIGVPALAALACVFAPLRERMLPWLALAPLPAIAASLVAVDAAPLVLGLPGGSYRASLALDAPGAILLGIAALLWSLAGAYASSYQRDDPQRGRFAACWLLSLAGCLGVFVAADMVVLYLALATMTLGASGLVFHDESAPARRAAGTYLAIALAGESLVLVGMIAAVLHTPGQSLAIAEVAAALPASPARDVTLALLLAGFGIKAGLVPLHVWMPLAHAAAPMPASAVLSGAVVKAGIIGLIRFLPVEPTLADAGTWLAVAGMVTALYAVAVGVTQSHPKVVLAYSSVSQMGFVAAVIGMGVANADAATPLLAAFYAGHHVLVKGAMFLLVGVVAASGSARLRPTFALAAFVALGLGGLPLTGGAIAKYAVKAPLGEGWAATVAVVSAAGTTLLMMHFLRRVSLVGLAGPRRARARGPARAVDRAGARVDRAAVDPVRGDPAGRAVERLRARGPREGAGTGRRRHRARAPARGPGRAAAAHPRRGSRRADRAGRARRGPRRRRARRAGRLDAPLGGRERRAGRGRGGDLRGDGAGLTSTASADPDAVRSPAWTRRSTN